MRQVLVAATLAVIWVGGKGGAHEFWIDPLRFAVPVGEAVEAQLRTGTEFVGSPHSYLPRNFERFDLVVGGDTRAVEGRLGDLPALSVEDLPDGLTVIVHETTARSLTWSTWERFLGFAEHKDLGDVTAMQAARGLDQEDVREEYYRFAKSLVAVGEGGGSDARVGLLTEFVALANPYTEDVSGGLPVELWYDGALRPNVQVELFERAPDGEVSITLHQTDDQGVALLPVVPGHIYMVDAVVLEPFEPFESRDPEWLTYWANLTFAVP